MQVNANVVNEAPRAAATLVMLRDGEQGLEVFLLKRHGLSDVLGGAYVFPGGKLDPSDGELPAAQYLDQPEQELLRALNEPEIDATMATAIYVAALREAYEESGVLFTGSASQAQLRQAQSHSRDATGFGQMLSLTGLRLASSAMFPWVRWITPRVPSMMNRRFDTRFFVAAVPADQVARHDDHEAVESAWLTPRRALQQYWQREIELAPPQIMSLAHLSRFPDVAAATSDARRRLPPVVQPEPFDEDGARVICYPGDERHSVRERALPGPTRLHHRDGRFEPTGGFEALFE